jgi:hypothetical protein
MFTLHMILPNVRRVGPLLTVLAASLLAMTAVAAVAETVNIDRFYTADAIVTGTDMRQRPWGMAQCLREVLVKVSGDPRLHDDPRVVALATHAADLVTSFDYLDLMAGIPKKDDQGSYDRPHRLTVHFDRAEIDRTLASFGEKPWRGERPVVVPVLLVQGPRPPPYLLSAETPAGIDQRGAFVNAAALFGIGVRFASDAELAGWNITAEHFSPASILPRANGKPPETVVIGTLRWNEALPGWVGEWHTVWHGAAHVWRISGVNYDAAFRDIVRGIVLLASGHGSPD